jgi:hypothetical protein
MKTPIFLRIASIITLLYFAGHTSGVPWTPDADAGPVPVLEAMKSHSFEILGSTRTYWDFYVGFGIIISLYMLMQAVVLWQLASLAKTDPLRVRPIVASFFVAFIVNTILAWKYFFVIPMVVSAAISMCLALAFVTAGRTKDAQ